MRNALRAIVLGAALLLTGLISADAATNPSTIPSFATVTVLKSAYPAGLASVPPVVEVTGSVTQSDGRGGLYWYNASDTTSTARPTIIVDNAGRRWYALNLQNNAAVAYGTVTPYQFGAYCDGGTHNITTQDIANNPQWIGPPTGGAYVVGTSWDTVANQEAIYSAFAKSSTPGTVRWNSLSGGAGIGFNRPWLLPYGTCLINKQILLVASGMSFSFGQRLSTNWQWIGDQTVSMFVADSASYCEFNNVTLQGTMRPAPATTPAFLMQMDYTGTHVGTRTQQCALNNLTLSLSFLGRGLIIAPSGGGAQGDTININNININGGTVGDVGVEIVGANALGVNFFGGDIQGIPHHPILADQGSFHVYGTNFENQETYGGYGLIPVWGQIQTGGADTQTVSTCGVTCMPSVRDVRSESDVANSFFGGGISDNVTLAQVGIGGWNASFPFGRGAAISSGNPDYLTFIEVADGGNGYLNTPTQTINCTFTDNTQTWTINQWADRPFFLIFTGHTQEHHRIVSNTAHVLTFDPSDCFSASPVNTGNQLYHIGGYTDVAPPTWSSAALALYSTKSPGTAQAFTTTANSTTVTTGSIMGGSAMVGQYVFIPMVGVAVGNTCNDPPPGNICPTLPAPLLARITNVAAGTPVTLTLDTPAGVSATDAPGYLGDGLADNQVTWMNIPVSVAETSRTFNNEISNFSYPQGVVWNYNSARNVNTNTQDWYKVISSITSLGRSLSSSTQQGPAPCGISYSATVDLTACIISNNAATLTPTGVVALTWASPAILSTQNFAIQFTSDGGSEVITCSTNLKCTGTLNMGAVAGKVFWMSFKAVNGTLYETARTGAE